MRLLSLLLLSVFICGCQKVSDGDCPHMKCSAKAKPTVYIIGDSTVNNTNGDLRGWGNIIDTCFDLDKITVVNRARGGRSSRTFLTEGLWNVIQTELKPGDYVIMQFGHNDGGPIAKGKARASLKGIGPETQTVTVENTGNEEVVMSYGGYLRKYTNDALAKGAIPIICSPVPRNMWASDKSTVLRNNKDYGLWSKQTAQACGVEFIDLNEITAVKYEKLGSEYISKEFFLEDHTHTTIAGAIVNAESVVAGIRSLKNCKLKNYLK